MSEKVTLVSIPNKQGEGELSINPQWITSIGRGFSTPDENGRQRLTWLILYMGNGERYAFEDEEAQMVAKALAEYTYYMALVTGA